MFSPCRRFRFTFFYPLLDLTYILTPSSQNKKLPVTLLKYFPVLEQLLVKDFSLDSITCSPRQTTYVPGVDYMTSYDDWLYIQARALFIIIAVVLCALDLTFFLLTFFFPFHAHSVPPAYERSVDGGHRRRNRKRDSIYRKYIYM